MISSATADRLWERVEPQVFITREQFFDELAGWELNEVAVDGKVAFVTAQKGPLFHFHSMGTGARISLRMIRDFLAPILAEHGYAITQCPRDDGRQQRFNLKLGFVPAGESEFHTTFRITSING